MLWGCEPCTLSRAVQTQLCAWVAQGLSCHSDQSSLLMRPLCRPLIMKPRMGFIMTQPLSLVSILSVTLKFRQESLQGQMPRLTFQSPALQNSPLTLKAKYPAYLYLLTYQCRALRHLSTLIMHLRKSALGLQRLFWTLSCSGVTNQLVHWVFHCCFFFEYNLTLGSGRANAQSKETTCTTC